MCLSVNEAAKVMIKVKLLTMSAIDIILSSTIVLSVFLNGGVIAALTIQWKELNAHDVILLVLSICDFFQAIIAFPLEVSANLEENKIQCIISGFSALSLALISIALITSMSIGRMISISYPVKYYGMMKNKNNSVYFILPSLLYGFMWASFLILGWSKYAPELESKQRCSINLNDRNIETISYLYSLLIFAYILPLILMAISFAKNKKQFRKMTRFEKAGKRPAATEGARSTEKRYTTLVLVMVVAFLFAWTLMQLWFLL